MTREDIYRKMEEIRLQGRGASGEEKRELDRKYDRLQSELRNLDEQR